MASQKKLSVLMLVAPQKEATRSEPPQHSSSVLWVSSSEEKGKQNVAARLTTTLHRHRRMLLLLLLSSSVLCKHLPRLHSESHHDRCIALWSYDVHLKKESVHGRREAVPFVDQDA